jgi:LPXTG-site transpeptidase (sortase) family protein
MSPRWHGPVAWLVLAMVVLAGCGGKATSAAAPSTTAAGATSVAPAPPTPTAVPATPTVAATTSKTSTTTTSSAVAARATATPVPVIPVKLQIPAINVTAPVEVVGLTSTGAMDVPKQWNDVGWYEYGPTPGEVGNSAMAGHLDSTTAPAVFWRLGSLKPGDKVMVSLSNKQTVTFVVTAKVTYPYNSAPIDKVFGPASTANLNLITCGGSWDAFTKNYSNRIVVYTKKA